LQKNIFTLYPNTTMGKIQFGVLLKTFAQWTTLGFIYMYNTNEYGNN